MSNPSDFVIENGVLKKYMGPGGDVVIPEGVTSIGNSAFKGCSKLTSVTIPASVTSIGKWAFCGCEKLTSVVIPESVMNIGDYAFSWCYSLTNVAIPQGVTSIGNDAFTYCSSLTSVTIPASVTSINRSAFSNCSSLTSMIIPGSVTSIDESVFSGCSSLTSVTIPESVTSINRSAFSNCSSLTSVTIPENVTSIGDSAFSGCSSLTGIKIPESVISVGEDAFAGCTSLQEFEVSPELRSLGKDPFGFGELPKGLIEKLDSFYRALTDASIKNYILESTASQKTSLWTRLPISTKVQIYLTKQSKNLTDIYRRCVDAETADQIRQVLMARLSGKASVKDCNIAGTFLITLYDKVQPELLQELYVKLKNEKNGTKAIKEVEEQVELMEKLGGSVEVDPTLPLIMQKVMTALIAEKMTSKDLKKKLTDCYKLTLMDLPTVNAKDGMMIDTLAIAWLLTVHEKVTTDRWGGKNTVPSYLQPGLCPDAAEIMELFDTTEMQSALLKLATEHLGGKGANTKHYLAYPICRYADESTMIKLTSRAPQWRSGVSGDDAPALYYFRKAVKYSNTRAAMLFAERYGELDEYAKLRGMTEDEMRDKYLSDVGLDEQGGKLYDLGNQVVTARLQKDLSFLFELTEGKTAKSLPKKGADPGKYEAAKTDFDEMRKAVRKIVKSRSDNLFQNFLSGKTRKADDWQDAYLKNPLLRGVAELVVWDQSGETFILADSKPIDSSEQPYTITDKPIKVAHPMEMEEKTVKAWQKYFTKHSLKQPFLQVWEPVVDPGTIREDRYKGCVQPMYRFTGKDKHGIHSGNLHAYSGAFGFTLEGCKLEYEASTWRISYEGADGETYTLGKFSFEKYTRQVNHIVSLLDSWTVEDRIKKDDISVADRLDSFTLAQITEFIKTAQEAQAVNVLALLLEYKNVHFADFDPMEEFTLE